MLTFLGFVAVAFYLLYKRSTEIVVVNPLRDARLYPPPSPRSENPAGGPIDQMDFSRLLNTIQQASAQPGGLKRPNAVNNGRAAIRLMVKNNQFIEAIQLYRRLYGVDLAAAKKAVDAMMLEQ